MSCSLSTPLSLTTDPIFREFSSWFGHVPEGFTTDFVGQFIDSKFQGSDCGNQGPRVQQNHRLGRLGINEEIFEWKHLLSAILDAQEQFVMLELGAGYGYWSMAAACALRIKHPTLPFALTAVEAEPTHFRWLNQHFINNGVPPHQHRLMQAAVNGSEGEVNFVIGHASTWYGQAIVDNPDYHQQGLPESHTIQVRSVTMDNLLSGIERIDYLDMDIQGAELSAIQTGIAAMTRCVRRAFVATHSASIEKELIAIFRRSGWYHSYLYPCGATAITPFGKISFVDGAQCWINPAI